METAVYQLPYLKSFEGNTFLKLTFSLFYLLDLLDLLDHDQVYYLLIFIMNSYR